MYLNNLILLKLKMENKNLYITSDKIINKLIKKVYLYMESIDKNYIEDEIRKAYVYSKNAHEWQFRLSWDPYIIHPVEATLLLLEIKPDIATIQACLLHDVIEDTPKTYDDIKESFWKEVADLCYWMEKLTKVRYTWEDRSIWSLRKMFVSMADDLRVIFIKLADRLHNMKTLKSHPKKEKRERIALETLNIYAPIADRLWLWYFKNSLDEECFKILEPKDYKNIKKQLSDLKESRTSFKKNVENVVNSLFVGSWIDYEIDFRVKSIYSIYKKMKRNNIEDVEDLYDLYWVRIVVQNESDCYRSLWIIHNKCTPIPKKFKDYIALPKVNGYRSIHTTVLWLLKNYRKVPTEIQIKTKEMKEHSDLWVAAHFEYKEKWSKIAKDISWVSELKELTENLWNLDFMDSLKIDVFKDRIFVLTPNWDSINLPAWSTAIDFAYDLHTDLWNHITIAKVNWKIYPLDKELKNWDIVEVIIDKNKTPNPFWASFVKTVKAKNAIKSFMKREDKDLHRDRWREILNKYLAKASLDWLDKDLTLLKNLDDRVYSIEERWQLLEQIWNFSITPSLLIKRIFKTKKSYNKNNDKIVKDKTKKWENKCKHNIIIWWDFNIDYKLWACCKRRMPEKIVAHVNNKWIITIHNRDCDVLKEVNRNKLLSAFYEWEEDNTIKVDIIFTFKNQYWVLKELSDILYAMQIDILNINSDRTPLNDVELHLKLELLEYDYLIIERFIDRVKLKLSNSFVKFVISHVEW